MHASTPDGVLPHLYHEPVGNDPPGTLRVTVLDRIAMTLAEAGVKRIYGGMGDSLDPLANAVQAAPRLAWLALRGESAAVAAAAAEAHLTGTLTVCAGNSGSGNLRLLDRLHDAHCRRAPLLAIAMHASTRDIGSGDDEVRAEALFRQCCGFCELISHSHQMPRLLRRAVETAVTRPGVAVLLLPADVALRRATPAEPADALRSGISTAMYPRASARWRGTRPIIGNAFVSNALPPALRALMSTALGRRPAPVVIAASDTGISEALGAQLSDADRLVFAVVDDAALHTVAGDLSSLLELRAPVKVVVLRTDARIAGAPLGVFAKIAEALGVRGLVARTATDACSAVDQSIAYPGPALIELSLPDAAICRVSSRAEPSIRVTRWD